MLASTDPMHTRVGKRKESIMKNKIYGVMLAAAVATFGTLFAPNANADCGYSAHPQWATAASPARTQNGVQKEQDDASSGQATLVGLWHIKISAGGQVIIQGIEAFHGDGTETLNDTDAPSSGNVCLGVWTQSGARTYKLKHPFWRWDAAGNLIGSAVIRQEVTVDKGSQTFSGTAKVDFLDLSGNVLFQLQQDVTGERITVDF